MARASRHLKWEPQVHVLLTDRHNGTDDAQEASTDWAKVVEQQAQARMIQRAKDARVVARWKRDSFVARLNRDKIAKRRELVAEDTD
jgi:hypothetical protein